MISTTCSRRCFIKKAGIAASSAVVSLHAARMFQAPIASGAETQTTSASFAVKKLTLKQSLDLAGRNQLAILNPEKQYIPTGGWRVSHDTGRWWDAILRLEHATGFVIPGELEGAMMRNLELFTGNPDSLLLIPPDLKEFDPGFELHSLREGLLAFNALVRFRNSSWAKEKGHVMLKTIKDCLYPDCTLDNSKFKYHELLGNPQPAPGTYTPLRDEDFIDMTGSTGRFLEAVVWFYEATGDPLAFEVAERLARFHLVHSTKPDGALFITETHTGHSHSYLGTLRGLLLFGMLTNQHEYIERVAATYHKAVPYVVKESGWAAHDLVGLKGKGSFFDQLGNLLPEHATPGDAAQIALWLALYNGYTELFDDVERIVRSRILPGQMTEQDAENNPNKNIPKPVGQSVRGAHLQEIPKKSIGGWCVHAWPHAGKGCTNDVASAVLHTMTDVYTHVTTRSEAGLKIHLLFDYEDADVSITTERKDKAVVTVRPRIVENLFIRIPGWAPRDSVRVELNGRRIEPLLSGSYIFIPKDSIREDTVIVFQHALPERRTSEKLLKSEYEFMWRGDEIVGVKPQEGPFPFYPPM